MLFIDQFSGSCGSAQGQERQKDPQFVKDATPLISGLHPHAANHRQNGFDSFRNWETAGTIGYAVLCSNLTRSGPFLAVGGFRTAEIGFLAFNAPLSHNSPSEPDSFIAAIGIIK